jgi:hypothetical protein
MNMKAEDLTFEEKPKNWLFRFPHATKTAANRATGTRKQTSLKSQQRGIGLDRSGSQQTKPVFACVDKFFEAFVSGESRSPGRSSICEAPFHAIESFLALDRKLACQFFHRACFLPQRLEIGTGHKGFIGLVGRDLRKAKRRISFP